MSTSHEALVAATRAIALPDVASAADLARHLHLSESAVRGLLRTGVIPGRKLGRKWFVSRQALLSVLAEQEASHVA